MTQNTHYMQGENLIKLNAIRVIIVLLIALGYASTMPIGPGNPEKLAHLGYDPSWIGIQILFFLSGYLALKSLRRHGSGLLYLKSRFIRNFPLLVIVTLITVLVLFPIFGTPHGSLSETLKMLTIYFLGTVSCIHPGEPLPGLLDEAKYMCVIQGAIWTLKWGVIAHITAVIGNALGLFKHNIVLVLMAIVSVIAYFILHFAAVRTDMGIPSSLLLASRLSWPFITGMAVYAYRDKLSPRVNFNVLIASTLFAATLFMYMFLPWSPAIEIFLTCAWGWLCMTLIWLPTNKMKFLNQWPALALAVYLINWPTSQILLLVLPELSPWQLIGLSLPLTTAIAWIAHIIISSPSYKKAETIAVQSA